MAEETWRIRDAYAHMWIDEEAGRAAFYEWLAENNAEVAHNERHRVLALLEEVDSEQRDQEGNIALAELRDRINEGPASMHEGTGDE